MNAILITILLLTDVLTYLIFFDVILSWLTLLGIRFRPKIVADLVDPIYKSIKKVIPTTFGMFEFAPFIVILILWFIQWIIYSFNPDLIVIYKDLLKF